MMSKQKLGAHELLEIHEVLCDAIDGINMFQLYQPYCKDQELKNILQNQINFMKNEYNSIISLLNNKTDSTTTTMGTNLASMRPMVNTNFTPTYGLDNPVNNEPNMTATQMDDRDVASGMLGASKKSATLRMHAALECADPQLRNAIIQGARNCADQAYETWQYMNTKGYYQVPTLQDRTADTFSGVYQPTTAASSTMNSLNQYNTSGLMNQQTTTNSGMTNNTFGMMNQQTNNNSSTMNPNTSNTMNQ